MAVVHSVAKILMVSVASAALVCAAAGSARAGFDWTPPATAQAAPSAAAPAETQAVDPNLLTPEPDASAPVAPVEGAMLQPGDNLPAPGEPVRDAASAPAPVAPAPQPAAEPVAAPAAQPAPQPESATNYRHLSRAESHAQYENNQHKQPVGMKTISSRETGAAPAPKKAEQETVWNAEPAPQPVEAAATPAAPAQSFDTTPLQGFGKDISLAIALSQIVPPSYAYKFSDGVNPGQKVSWQGGKPWTQVLSDVLVANNLEVVIQGNVVKVQQPSGSAAAVSAPAETEAASSISSSETKVARLAPAATVTDDGGSDLPVPTGKPMAVTAPADTLEAQDVEASEKQAIESSAPAEQPVAVVAANDAKAPVVDINTTRRWEATPGKTLRETLESWSSTAGAELEWMSPYDFPVDHSFVYEGKYGDAVESLLSLYSREQQRPRGRLYPNLPTGPSVLMVN